MLWERIFKDHIFIARLTPSASSITLDQCPLFLCFTVPSLLLLTPYVLSCFTMTLTAVGAATTGEVGNGKGK